MTIAVVQTTGAVKSPGTSIAVTLTGVVSTNCLLLIVGSLPSSVPIGFVPLYLPTSAVSRVCFYINANPSTGSNTATVNFSSSVYTTASLTEISGLGVPALDIVNVTNSGVVTSISVASGVLSQSTEIVIAAMSYNVNAGSTNAAITDPPTGFTSIYASQNSLTNQPTEHCYAIVSATTSLTASWSWTDTVITGAQAAIISLRVGTTIPSQNNLSLMGVGV